MPAVRKNVVMVLLLLMITVALSVIRVPSAVAVYDNVKFALKHDFGLPAPLRVKSGALGILSQQIRDWNERLPRVVPRP